MICRLSMFCAFAALLVLHPATASGAGSRKARRAPAPQAGTVVLDAATTDRAGGETLPFELGTLYVPENRSAPDSRLIGVGFVRLRAAAPTTAPPIFALPGGPGSSDVDAFTSSDEDSKDTVEMYAQMTAVADVVIVDQRGFSTRGEVLTVPTLPVPLDIPASPESDAAWWAAMAERTVAAYPDIDLAGYTVVEMAADVNDLRKALGYTQITLHGGSFGSQESFAVMRLHPEIVARALLSGVEPLNNAYDMPSHVLAAVQRIAWDADRDPGLAPYLPPGGLMAALRSVRERFARGPVEIAVDDDKGKRQTVVLGLTDFQASLTRRPRTLPGFVLSLYHQHYEDWAREVLDANEPGVQPAINQLVDSSLGVTAEREHLLRTDYATDLLGTGGFAPFIAAASLYPTPDVGDALRIPVSSDIPVLFIHGDWDTSTPIENTLGMLPYFPNGRTLLVHRGMHGARYHLLDEQPAVREAIFEFLRTGDPNPVPLTAELAAPAFQPPPFPPPR